MESNEDLRSDAVCRHSQEENLEALLELELKLDLFFAEVPILGCRIPIVASFVDISKMDFTILAFDFVPTYLDLSIGFSLLLSFFVLISFKKFMPNLLLSLI